MEGSWRVFFPVPPSTLSTKRCSQQECVESEWCWGQPMFQKCSSWRSALGFVMCFPDLSSLKYLLSWLLGGLPHIAFSFQPLQRILQLWRAVLSEAYPFLRWIISIDWFIWKCKGMAILAYLTTTLWGKYSFRAQCGFGWGCHWAWTVA